MDFYIVFSKVLVIFSLIIIGYFVYKKRLITADGQRDLTNLLLYVFLPSALIRSFNMPFDALVFKNGLQIIVIMAIIYSISTLFAIFLSKLITKDSSKQPILVLGMILPNAGFMGFPIVEAVLGPEYVFYAVMGNIAFELITWTVMVNLIIKSTGVKDNKNIIQRLFSMPSIPAILIGILIYISPWSLPDTLFSTLNILGNAMTPVAMLIVGMSLAKADIHRIIFEKELYLVSLIRLILIPLTVFLVLRLFGIEGILLTIPVVSAAMPTAGYTSIVAGKFGADPTLGAEIITICTLLSMITIPVIFTLL